MSRFIVVLLLVLFAAAPLSALAADNTGTLTGTVKTNGGVPVAGAQVEVSGAERHSARTDATGDFSFTLPPGLYNVSVTKGGYVPAESTDLAVFTGESVPLQITLEQADLSSLRTIASVSSSGRGSSINTGAASISYLPGVAIQNLANPQINDVMQHMPDVVIQKMGSQPDTTIVLGGVQPYETQVLIDGHPLSLGEYGVWLSQYFPSFMLAGVETQVGPGNTTPFASTAVGGTANLLTPSFTTKQTFNFVIGSDNYDSQYSNFLATGSYKKFQYVAGLGYGSNNGPFFGGTKCVVNPDNFSSGVNQPGAVGTVQFCDSSSGSLFQKGDILKLRYNFSPVTSFDVGAVGAHGGFLPQGTSYGQYLGMTTIEPCLGANPSSCNNPQYNNLIGQKIPAYAWYPGSNVTFDQTIFTGQFRTSLGNDTILLRPYAGNISQVLDGASEDQYPLYFSPAGQAPGTAPTFGNCTGSPTGGPIAGLCTNWEASCYNTFIGQVLGYNATPTVKSGQEECYQTQFSELETDKLYGNTFTWLHPFNDGDLLTFTYDFHGDHSYGYYNANVPADVTVPSTLEHYTTISLVGDIRASRTVDVKGGLYDSIWSVSGSQNATALATPGPDGLVAQIPLQRSVSRFDPHIALTFQPNSNVSYRAAFGTSETFPFAGYISGQPFYTQPSATSATLAPSGFVSYKDPNLNPETSTEFSLGMDLRVRHDGIFRVDLTNTEVTNVFELLTTPSALSCPQPVVGPPTNSCWPFAVPGTLATLQPTNAAKLSVQRAIVSYTYAPKVGFGYNGSMAFEQSQVQGIPLVFYGLAPTLPANNVQTCGYGNTIPGSTTCIPFMKGYFQATYTAADGTFAGLGADFEGKNNTYFQPPFLQFDLSVKKPITQNLEAQISVQNLLNTNNFYDLPMPNVGVTTTAGYAPGPFGGPYNYGQTSYPSTLNPAPPRTFRFQLRWHTGIP
jgi:hypothetical protein